MGISPEQVGYVFGALLIIGIVARIIWPAYRYREGIGYVVVKAAPVIARGIVKNIHLILFAVGIFALWIYGSYGLAIVLTDNATEAQVMLAAMFIWLGSGFALVWILEPLENNKKSDDVSRLRANSEVDHGGE